MYHSVVKEKITVLSSSKLSFKIVSAYMLPQSRFTQVDVLPSKNQALCQLNYTVSNIKIL